MDKTDAKEYESANACCDSNVPVTSISADETLRLECLKMANACYIGTDAVDLANEYYNFVKAIKKENVNAPIDI